MIQDRLEEPRERLSGTRYLHQGEGECASGEASAARASPGQELRRTPTSVRAEKSGSRTTRIGRVYAAPAESCLPLAAQARQFAANILEPPNGDGN